MLARTADRVGQRIQLPHVQQTIALLPLADLSKPFQRNVPPQQLFSREHSVRQMLAVIDGITMSQNGSYLDYAGQPIEW